MDLHWIPVVRNWRLNERMYGGLTGLDKSETAAKHGEKQVKVSTRIKLYCLFILLIHIVRIRLKFKLFLSELSSEQCGNSLRTKLMCAY